MFFWSIKKRECEEKEQNSLFNLTTVGTHLREEKKNQRYCEENKSM